MTWQNMRQLAGSDYGKLLPILALAFYIAFIPHYHYPYPVHIDEWVHLWNGEMVLRSGSAGLGASLEPGFNLFWTVFQSISGIPWLTIVRYFPGIVFIITILSVYTLAHRQGFGWEAALFTSLIPTTVGILGPAFMVPVATGLLFIPLSLFVALNFRTGWAYLVLFIFTSALLALHPPTAVGLVIILLPYILLSIRGDLKHSVGIILVLAIPFVALFPWIFNLLLPTAKTLLSPQPLPIYVDLPPVIQLVGYLPIGLCLLGTFLLARRGGKKNLGLVLGLVALLVMLVTFFTFHYGVSIMYERGLMYIILVLSIVAGAGLAGIRTITLSANFIGRFKPFLARNVGNILCLVLIGLTLVIAIPARQSMYYYHMIDEQDYEAFIWVRDNVGEDYEKALLDPWKATAFAAITQKSIYTRIHEYTKVSDERAYQFLRSGCTNTTFLEENDISIVYSRGVCDNPDLAEVRKNIYLLK